MWRNKRFYFPRRTFVYSYFRFKTVDFDGTAKPNVPLVKFWKSRQNNIKCLWKRVLNTFKLFWRLIRLLMFSGGVTRAQRSRSQQWQQPYPIYINICNYLFLESRWMGLDHRLYIVNGLDQGVITSLILNYVLR